MLYILNESKDAKIAGDLTVYSSLNKVSLDIEPIDVSEEAYFLFDTDGNFYSIGATKLFDHFEYAIKECNVNMAQALIKSYFRKITYPYNPQFSLEENVSLLGVDSSV